MTKKNLSIALFATWILGGDVVRAQEADFKSGQLLRSITVGYNQVGNRVSLPFVAEDERFRSELEVRKLFSTEQGAGGSLRYTNTFVLSKRVNLDLGTGFAFIPTKNSYRWGQFEDAKLMVFDRVDHYKNLYVNIPINVKLNVYKRKFWLDAGFQMMVNAYQFNTRLESKTQYGRNGLDQLVPVAEIYKDQTVGFRISSFDFGVFGGVEAMIFNNVALTGRYYYNVNKLVRLFPDVYQNYFEGGLRYYINR